MKKHYRYLSIFVLAAVLLGLSVAAWSDSGDDREPNVPIQDQEFSIPTENSDSPGLGENQGPTDPSASWDKYKIVIERNIFSRQRGPRVERTRRQAPAAPPAPDPESYVVLKGIVQEDGAFIAFLEDTQTGQVLRVREGDSVVRGKIKSLTLDSLEYEFEDRTMTVTMGLNLQGGREGADFTGTYDFSPTSSTTTSATTESSAPPSEDEAEILRQLMERRKQQVGP